MVSQSHHPSSPNKQNGNDATSPLNTRVASGVGALRKAVTSVTNPDGYAEQERLRQRKAREKAAQSRSGLWGPTHSCDSSSDEDDHRDHPTYSTREVTAITGNTKDEGGADGHGNSSIYDGCGMQSPHKFVIAAATSCSSPAAAATYANGNAHSSRSAPQNEHSSASSSQQQHSMQSSAFSRIIETATAAVNGLVSSTSSPMMGVDSCSPCRADIKNGQTDRINDGGGFHDYNKQRRRQRNFAFDDNGDDYHQEQAKPPTVMDSVISQAKLKLSKMGMGVGFTGESNYNDDKEEFDGVSPLHQTSPPPPPQFNSVKIRSDTTNITGGSSAVERRLQRHKALVAAQQQKQQQINSPTDTAAVSSSPATKKEEEYDDAEARQAAAEMAAVATSPENTASAAADGRAYGVEAAADASPLPFAPLWLTKPTSPEAAPNGGAAAVGAEAVAALFRPPKPAQPTKDEKIPFETLTFKNTQIQEFQRSVSELTMRSSYGEATAKLTDSRRMAYYAVGKHHETVNKRRSGHGDGNGVGNGTAGQQRGGNRRCYFTGRLIYTGAPFYAGSVQQGLRTLVVFCLPSAIGFPKPEQVKKLMASSNKKNVNVSRKSIMTASTQGGTQVTSIDDMSLSAEDDTMDPNMALDTEALLEVLPEPSQDLLDRMKDRYPTQFNTLPVQVRSPHCWRLFIKFCFFSGLPIAEGELHYKVRDDIANEAYGEEIILSHDVMEAVNGELSADILRLPNKKTFKYLRKHYTQQSGKLTDAVFDRKSWEIVLPEV